MTRFQKLALITALTTYLLVVMGAVTRGTGSGMGCGTDWPLCHGVLPAFSDTAAWIEWLHRAIALAIGFLVTGIAVVAMLRHRGDPAIAVPAVAAFFLTLYQAYLGQVTVVTGNAGEAVTAHLATAMLVLALCIYLAIRLRYPMHLPVGGRSQRFTLLAAFAAAAVYALLLFGAHVRAIGASLAFPDWPLMDGRLIPAFSSDPTLAALQVANFSHRLVAVVVGLVLAWTAWVAWRRVRAQRSLPGGAEPSRLTLLALTGTSLGLYLVQAIVGGAQVTTSLADWAVILHVALGAAIWGVLVATTIYAYCEARTAAVARPTDPDATRASSDRPGLRGPEGSTGPAVSVAVAHPPAHHAPGDRQLRTDPRWPTLRAYVALTKPRIIELLLVTTVPAMVVAARGLPRPDLVAWTLLGGALAAGAANAINQYLDRDIDELMSRTRRRPLPAHAIPPENGLVFGLGLGVVAFGVLTIFVNLLAAFLSLLAMAFYVVVYTILLKRSTPQNIVIGGAAGALPPVIGWAAVTGDVTIPAVMLFLIVFYWTPPHFWALSMRLRGDYDAARVPMLPVVRGIPETARQIGIYSLVMVALTLAFFVVGHMGAVYLAGAVVLGALFLRQALLMWRERSEARAIRLYRYSITYLTALFALMALDVLLPIAL